MTRCPPQNRTIFTSNSPRSIQEVEPTDDDESALSQEKALLAARACVLYCNGMKQAECVEQESAAPRGDTLAALLARQDLQPRQTNETQNTTQHGIFPKHTEREATHSNAE